MDHETAEHIMSETLDEEGSKAVEYLAITSRDPEAIARFIDGRARALAAELRRATTAMAPDIAFSMRTASVRAAIDAQVSARCAAEVRSAALDQRRRAS